MSEVLGPTVLGGGSAIAQMIAAGPYVYFKSGTSLYRVAAAGGEPEALFSDDSSYGLVFAVQNERVLVATDTAIFEVGANAGEPRMLSELPEPVPADLLTGAMPFVFADQHAYFVGGASTDEGVTLYELDLASGLAKPLGAVAAGIDVLLHAGDALYWSESSAGRASPYANVLKRMPVSGGTAEELAVDLGPLRLAFEVLGATPEFALLDVSLVIGADNSDDAAVTAGGIYRQPLAGGKAIQLVESSALDLTNLFGLVPTRQVVEVGDTLFVRAGTPWRASIYSLSAGSTAAEPRFCVRLDEEFVTAMAVEGDALYLALSLDDESFILRRDL